MPYFEREGVRIQYEEAGSGFPLLVIPGGGLNSRIAHWQTSPFNAMEEFKADFYCLTMDQRNAIGGLSSGPVPSQHAWDAFADDQLSLLDHLGIDRFVALGLCIGGPFLLKLMERAPDRVVAGVICQPVGHRPENPNVMYDSSLESWGLPFRELHPKVTLEAIESYLASLYRSPADFVYSVTREFVRSCPVPMFVMPDDVPAHPYAVSMEIVQLAPNAEVSMYPWKQPKELIPAAVDSIRTFLTEHAPVPAH